MVQANISLSDENKSSNSKSMDVIGNPCYWFTENISRIPLIFLRYVVVIGICSQLFCL